MARKEKAPPPIVRKGPKGLHGVTGWDAEQIMGDAPGTEYDLVKRSRRSLPQHRLYWQVLSQVVRATGRWPTAEHLHHELKLVCGYKMTIVDWSTGEVSTAVDSTAFDAMNQDEFGAYFNLAISRLNEHLGFDVLAFMGDTA